MSPVFKVSVSSIVWICSIVASIWIAVTSFVNVTIDIKLKRNPIDSFLHSKNEKYLHHHHDRSLQQQQIYNSTPSPSPVGFVEMCRKIRGTTSGSNNNNTRYETISVPSLLAFVIRILGGTDGRCSSVCSVLCNSQPCAADYEVSNETCTCLPEKANVSRCTGPNVRCGYNSTCMCDYGFWSLNISTTGCPLVGYSVRDLPYPYEALEPYFDTRTMQLHHLRHHATSVANLNRALINDTDTLQKKSILELQNGAIQAGTTIRNNAGGHYNHALFWTILAPPAEANKTKPSKRLEKLINTSFGNMTAMKTRFETLAAPGSVFGSGWVWLCLNNSLTGLVLIGTPNQDNPLMDNGVNLTSYPILGLDVWEHAYYLKYQNLRPDYVKSFWNLVNWTKVSDNADKVIKNKIGVPVR